MEVFTCSCCSEEIIMNTLSGLYETDDLGLCWTRPYPWKHSPGWDKVLVDPVVVDWGDREPVYMAGYGYIG